MAPFDPALEARFSDETAELQRRRLRVMLPLMACLHVAHAGYFYSTLATLQGELHRWRHDLVVAHLVMLPLLLVVSFFVFRPKLPAWVPPFVAAAYLQHGAWVAGIDQIVSSNITVYVGYCFGVAVVMPLSLRLSALVYSAGAASMVAALMLFQRSSSALLTNLPTCASLTVVCVAFSWFLHAARRREWSQRAIIDRQRDELAVLNASLSERVKEQVGEILAHATEVDRLNAQLRAQVRARSDELSLALSRLADRRNADGTLTIGLVLADRFEVAERLGQGGMGTVYAGIDRTTRGRVAIKVIQASSIHQLDSMRRFIREVGVTATVTHPAVVRMLHLDVSADGLLFQVQELVDGATLTTLLGEPWPPGWAARLGAVLCDALAAAHAAGVVHRDIKPDNVMLTARAPGLKLLDFGIAKLYDAVADPGATSARVIIGTPGYMAPEQSHADAHLTDRADLYAVGVLLTQLLTGHLPGTSTPPAMVARCLADDPAARPSAAELSGELAKVADGAGAPPLEVIVERVGTGRSGSEASVPTTPMRRAD